VIKIAYDKSYTIWLHLESSVSKIRLCAVNSLQFSARFTSEWELTSGFTVQFRCPCVAVTKKVSALVCRVRFVRPARRAQRWPLGYLGVRCCCIFLSRLS